MWNFGFDSLASMSVSEIGIHHQNDHILAQKLIIELIEPSNLGV